MPQRPYFALRTADLDIETGTVFAPKFDGKGLIPVVTTEANSGEVVMFAYMNDEALARTIETGEAYYWSRSRSELWHKGATSGNVQRVVEMRTDCDQDTILMKVEMRGAKAACHVGYRSCFYRSIAVGALPDEALELTFRENKKLFDPDSVY
ncbi:phosphoribosyl-AMP cyclohydrolase [bacterium MnTg02]|nr:phosphoribosyl-AMP cyclohydrolase [bacterium MnTg02]